MPSSGASSLAPDAFEIARPVDIGGRRRKFQRHDTPRPVAQQLPRALIAVQAAQLRKISPRKDRRRTDDAAGSRRNDGRGGCAPGGAQELEIRGTDEDLVREQHDRRARIGWQGRNAKRQGAAEAGLPAAIDHRADRQVLEFAREARRSRAEDNDATSGRGRERDACRAPEQRFAA